MLTIILGSDWTANRNYVLNMLAEDVAKRKGNRILLVPELISHDTERRLCMTAGDTSSRYAEVVSFSRLTRRICDWAGYGMQDCLDNGGRLVAMAAAARQLHSKLKAYASLETNPEFLSSLVDAVDEFKRCCISAVDLTAASCQAEGAFAQKLEELALLLEAYDAICVQGKRDPRDQLTWGLELLQDCDYAQNHVFYIDGFPDFTVQNMTIISHLIAYAPQVVISMHCDKPGSGKLAFQKSSDTVSKLLRIAKKVGAEVSIKTVEPAATKFSGVKDQLFQGRIVSTEPKTDDLRIVQAENIYEECVLASEEVLRLVHNGSRYKDFSVVCADLSTYQNALSMYFQMCGIPTYLAGTEDILEKPVIGTVLTALDAAIGGFDTKDVMRFMKSALSPLPLEDCDALENYAILWDIQGKKWLNEWTMHPEGLVDTWTAENTDKLESLNKSRRRIIEPLHTLSNAMSKAKNVCDRVSALYRFLDEIQLRDRLEELALEQNCSGDFRNEQILNQLWDILLSALEQLADVLGEINWDNDCFTRLFKLLLSQYDVGTIPPVLDAVMVGSVSALRCQEPKHLIVVGACEGVFPTYGATSGVLSEYERNALRQMGVPLTGGAAEGLEIEFSEIYSIFCGDLKTIHVSCLKDQGSFVFRRLCEIAGGEYLPQNVMGVSAVKPMDAAAYLLRSGDQRAAAQLGLSDCYRSTEEKCSYELGTISKDGIHGIYGSKLNLSASQIDKLADCRLSYFLKYGLRAKEQKPAAIDPAEFGTYVHAVLEQTAREICELGGFKHVNLEQTLQIAKKYSEEYMKNHFSQLETERISYLFRRNDRELMMVVEELWKEFQDSSFTPVDFEVAFGDYAQMPAISISSKTISAQLRGFVDRVDAWQEDGRNYFRVVDYKTGKNDFDYCDVFNGLGLQMLLYLFALEQEGEDLLGKNPIPAGVQYFPARVPVLSVDGDLSDEDAEKERQSLWKRKGLVLADDDVLRAMEDSDNPVRVSCRRRKDGTVSGDIASREQFKLLNRYVFHLLGNMVDEIASGNVKANPYTRGSSHNACRFCPFGAVCHAATVEDRRNYKVMSAQRFWDDIEKEMSRHE